MHIRRYAVSLAAIAVACAASFAAQAQTAKAALKDAGGKDVGQVQFVQTPHGVLIKLSVKGVPPGEHAFHIHSVGKCEPPFTSAGGHFNPGQKSHGMLSPNGPHAGDLPNLVVPASGKLDFELFVPGLTLNSGPTAVLDADGSAVVIHAKADDHQSQPAGDSGDRIACAVVAR